MTASKPQNTKEEILNDNMWRLMGRLSLPAIIGMSVNGINAFVDALFVGQMVGQDALAAISIAFPLTMVTNGFSAMIGVGASSLLSRAIGAQELDIQRKTFGAVTLLSFIVSIILSVFGISFAYELIGFMGGEGQVLEMGVTYYRIMMLGAFFRIYAVANNMLIRAEGKVKEAMIISIISTVLNMILNPIFIYYWGIAGAAWATNAAMVIFTLMNTWYFYRGKTSYPVSLTTFSLESRLLRPILQVGISAMMLQIMFFVQQVFVFKSLDYYGSEWDFAFMGASYRVIMLIIIPCFGFAQALQPVAGINFGARRFNRVKKAYRIFTVSSTIMIFVFCGFAMLFPHTVMGWMIPDTAFSNQDIWNLRLMLLGTPAFPLFFMGTTLFQSIGKGKEAGFLLVFRELILLVPAVLLLPLFYGIPGIYAAGIPTNLIIIGFTIFMTSRQFRKWN